MTAATCKRRLALRWVLLGPALLLSACGRSGPAADPVPADVAAVVDMTGLSFDPVEVRIRAGESVYWRNRSLFTHTVTCDPDLAASPARIALSDGAAPFASGRLAPGQVFRHRFTVPGTYAYVCLPHEELGMAGRVIVEAVPTG